MTKKRIVTILAALLALALLASVLFIALEADHDCQGEDCCAICAQLVVCGELLQQLAVLTVLVLVSAVLRSGAAVLRAALQRVCGRFSLVRLKVKLSD